MTPEEKAKAEEEKKNLKKQMALMPWVSTPTTVPAGESIDYKGINAYSILGHSLVRLLVCLHRSHSFAGSALLALLARFAALIRLFARSVTPRLVGKVVFRCVLAFL